MKKKLCMLLTILLVLSLIPAVAFAVDSSGGSGSGGTPAATPGVLSIANDYTNSDMKNVSYNNGYIPVVWDDKVVLVLPLKAPSSQIQSSNPQIQVTADLGDPATSPFVFQNYNQTLGVSAVDSQNNNIYVVTLTLQMNSNRVNGRYPVTINAQYTKSDGSADSQAFTVYVTVSNGIDPNATPAPTPTPTPEPTEAPLPQPKIIMDSHTITPEQVMAGDTFALNITLKNTSESQSVQNIKITAKGDTTDLIPVEDTGSAYIKKIGSGKTEDFLVKMQVRQDAKPGPQKVLLSIEYENSKAAAFTASEEIIVQVKQPIRLEYDKPTIPESVNSGDTISISMNLMNMGKSTLYNVRCTLEAAGLMPEGSVFIGNMESGTSKTGDIYAFVGTLDMGGANAAGESPEMPGSDASGGADVETGGDAADQAAGAASGAKPAVGEVPDTNGDIAQTVAVAMAVPEKAMVAPAPAVEGAPQDGMEEGDMGQAGQYGPTQGKIIISYEDEYGQEYSQEVEFQTVINPPAIQPVNNEGEETPEEPQTVSQWWISVIIAGGIAAGLIVFLKIRKKRRMLLEGENEDE